MDKSSSNTISMDGYKTERKVSRKKSSSSPSLWKWKIAEDTELKSCLLFPKPQNNLQSTICDSPKKNAIIFQGPSSASLNPDCLSSPSLSFASSQWRSIKLTFKLRFFICRPNSLLLILSELHRGGCELSFTSLNVWEWVHWPWLIEQLLLARNYIINAPQSSWSLWSFFFTILLYDQWRKQSKITDVIQVGCRG